MIVSSHLLAQDNTIYKPIEYVTKNSPPTFIVHGDADPTVPYQQSVDLHKKFDEAGVMNSSPFQAGCMAIFSKSRIPI